MFYPFSYLGESKADYVEASMSYNSGTLTVTATGTDHYIYDFRKDGTSFAFLNVPMLDNTKLTNYSTTNFNFAELGNASNLTYNTSPPSVNFGDAVSIADLNFTGWSNPLTQCTIVGNYDPHGSAAGYYNMFSTMPIASHGGLRLDARFNATAGDANTNSILFRATDVGNPKTYTNTNTFSTNVWAHWAITYNAGSVAIYKDGSSLAVTNVGTQPTSVTIPARTFIGSQSNASNAVTAEFEGDMADFKVYTTVLTGSQITELANGDTNKLTTSDSGTWTCSVTGVDANGDVVDTVVTNSVVI